MEECILWSHGKNEPRQTEKQELYVHSKYKTKGALIIGMERDLQEIGIMCDDVVERGNLNMKPKTHRNFKEKSKLKTGEKWTDAATMRNNATVLGTFRRK